MALLTAPPRNGYAFALMTLLVCSASNGQSVDEYQLKAAFLYNFAKFVEWPSRVFKGPGEPITICVLGQSQIARAVEEVVRGKTVEGRYFVVTRISEARQAAGCQILFVSASERKRSQSLLDDLNSSGVLTVGETEGFAAEGGVINLRLEASRIRLEINVAAAEQNHLRISSKLLSLAQIVRAGRTR